MATHPFKAFIPYKLQQAMMTRDNDPLSGLESLDDWIAPEPNGGQWSTIGLTPGIEGDYCHDLDGAGYLLMIRINERILPAKVRDEALAKEVEKVEKAEGRKVNKKEYAQMRDEVSLTLLPKAFVRRKDFAVFLMPGTRVLVCTSSQRTADIIVGYLLGLLTAAGVIDEPMISRVMPATPVDRMLTYLLDEGQWESTKYTLSIGKSAVLKGGESGKEVVRIKDKDLASHQVTSLIRNGDFTVRELALDAYKDEEEPDVSFVLNDNFTFKRIEYGGIKASMYKEDAHASAWIVAKRLPMLLTLAKKCADSMPAADSDEEL